MESLTSPFSGATVVPSASGVDGLEVEWLAQDAADRHGTLSDLFTEADGDGRSTTTYVPKQEDANGKGIEREEAGKINVGVTGANLLLQLYGSFAAPYAGSITGVVKHYDFLNIAWHEKIEAVVKIVWTDTYDGVDDTITFLGDLTDIQPSCSTVPPPDGPCSIDGSVMFMGTGTATGSRAGWAACNPGIDVIPSGTVDATFTASVDGNMMTVGAYADYDTNLSGVITGLFTVPLDDGTATFAPPPAQGPTPPPGELCPHHSSGVITVTGLLLPAP
jgi:hypothetical protein